MQDLRSYVVCDIEADGPIPGAHSMLAIGAVALDAAGMEEVGAFSRALLPLPDAAPNPETMAWWATQPEAWAAVTRGARPAGEVMAEFVAFVDALPQPVAFVAHPLAFDGAWMDHYLKRFTGLPLLAPPRATRRLFDGPGIDLPSLAVGVLGLSYGRCWRKDYPAAVYGDLPHDHDPVEDARGYAALFRRLLALRAGR